MSCGWEKATSGADQQSGWASARRGADGQDDEEDEEEDVSGPGSKPEEDWDKDVDEDEEDDVEEEEEEEQVGGDEEVLVLVLGGLLPGLAPAARGASSCGGGLGETAEAAGAGAAKRAAMRSRASEGYAEL